VAMFPLFGPLLALHSPRTARQRARIFTSKDGSIHDETTVYSQHDTFRLLTDRLIQKGPVFPHPVEVSIDAVNGTVTARLIEHGKNRVETKQLDIPEDASNGMSSRFLRTFRSAGLIK
jgi:hypothetical protein